MRVIAPSLLVLGLMIVGGMPSAVATHGDTAYLIGTDGLFFAESGYVTGPGYLNQFWDFSILSASGPDYCSLVNGGWDPHPTLGGTPGFTTQHPVSGSNPCNSGAHFSVTGIDHYHPYPNPGNGCAPVPACQGFDIHEVTVTYDGAVITAQLIICDNRTNANLARISSNYCTDLQMFT